MNELCLDATVLPPNRTMLSTGWSWALYFIRWDFSRLYWQIPFIWLFPGYFFSPFSLSLKCERTSYSYSYFIFHSDSTDRRDCSDIMLSCGESKHPTITRPEMIPLRKHIIVLEMPKKNCFSFFSSPFTNFSFFILAATLWHDNENEMRWQHTHITNAIDEVHRCQDRRRMNRTFLCDEEKWLVSRVQ